ncbi:melanophilin isoform X3 [Colius striatus]|uniref:melanophilin isoform X3 n=1 Tax=Colius striatus TaxID=57412 RepID=UPI002B1E8286|nr:melanophilin isoform X3 [Colius striatus]
MGRKLDLSKLTDEEAKHVWEVVQRDFDLRKKEEERLEDLKCKIDQESSKREFLTNQSHLNETHCVHCLQPFKFLLNSKRQCLDCQFYTCKNCSRYNKKEQGWVCDPCRLSRIVKIGSLEWYYEHVRSRFKRFGSAKVLQSLYGRLQPGQGVSSAFLGLHDRVYSLPDINSECQLLTSADIRDNSDDDDILHGAEAECYSRMRKTKRLLSVHPFDFELDSEYSAQSRRQSVQLSPAASSPDAFQSFPDFPNSAEDASEECRMADTDLVFHHILQEQGPSVSPPEQHFSTEVRLTVNSQRRSLERNAKPGSPWNEQPQSRYSADMDTSDEDVKGVQFLAYPPHHTKCGNRASFQENISQSGNQSPAPESQFDPNAEEEKLKRKLEELASNISDKEVTSEEEEREEEKREKKPETHYSRDDIARDAQKVYLTAGKTYWLEKTLKDLEEGALHSGTTDSELSELEDKVASAAAQVQQAETEISDIESRIAALSAAGLTVKPVEKARKKSSGQAACLSSPDPTNSSPGETSDDIKAMPRLQAFRRKFNSPLEITSPDDSFDRNSVYRGSLTQRNPNGKNRRVERLFAKPVMTHLS